MARNFTIKTPANFSFEHTLLSHGWYDLLPFELIGGNKIGLVLPRGKAGRSVVVTVSSASGGLKASVDGAEADRDGIIRDIRHIFRLDEEFDGFYETIANCGAVEWAANEKAGRLLRGPNVFEDLVKTLCTTNCSWALTRIMVTNLVAELGEAAANGKRAFPTAKALARKNEAFYREKIRAGYRAPYFVELAERVASGELDPESWLTSDLSTADLKKEIKKVKGIGEYAADNLLKLLGRYDCLALDSWVRGGFFKKHNNGRKCSDKKIEKHYKKFGEWRGLAIWCDMTEDWFFGEGRQNGS
ncbi:MAG: Fe-S cluster assembly protein HesB [Acidobacteria bacterium]|nr:Fe-S cluster assembly protein HesB [Acidobacteriota bacterium]